MTRTLTFALFLAASLLQAQPAAFKTLTIRENTTGFGPHDKWQIRRVTGTDTLSFEARYMTLKQLLVEAYGLRTDQVSGIPADLRQKHYDLKAELGKKYTFQTSEVPTDDRPFTPLQLMLRKVLRERFGLQAHFGTKDRAVYSLALVPGGPRPQKETIDCADEPSRNHAVPCGDFGLHDERLEGAALSMDKIADALSFYLSTTVTNRTRLPGTYHVNVQWKEDNGSTIAQIAAAISDAMQQQIGLKLEAATGPVTTLFVDHAEQPTLTP